MIRELWCCELELQLGHLGLQFLVLLLELVDEADEFCSGGQAEPEVLVV